LRLGLRPLWLERSDPADVLSALAGWQEDLAPLSALAADRAVAFASGPDPGRAGAAARILEADLATRLRGSVLGPWRSLDDAERRAAAGSLAEQVKLARRKASRNTEKQP
jgi:hypothetical protein